MDIKMLSFKTHAGYKGNDHSRKKKMGAQDCKYAEIIDTS